jgi:glycosyltransferase involved in cell wall biosynthesis
VLQLCLKVPYPPNDGGRIAMYNMQKSWWSNEIQVKVLTFNTIKHPVQLDQLPTDYLQKTNIEGVFLDNHVKIFDALKSLLKGESYNVKRFISSEFTDKLQSVLEHNTFDVVQLESLYMAPYIETIRQFSKAKIVFRPHNIEYKIWERLFKNQNNPFKNGYLRILTKQLKKYEQSVLNKVDLLLPLTIEDAELLTKMGCLKPIMVLPIGVETSKYPLLIPPNNHVVFHLGAMDWMPNYEGIKWFLKRVWPLVEQKNNKAELRLAGKGMPDEILKLKRNNVKVEEWIDDVSGYFEAGQIMIVPLLSGSGMRVKIIEGMAMGKAIVTTSIGLEGILAADRREVLIANEPAEFADRILELLDQPELVKSLGTAARRLVEERYELHFLGKKWKEFIANS